MEPTSNHNFAGYFNNMTVSPAYPIDAHWQAEIDGGSTNANQMMWRTLIWDSGTLPSGTTATFKGRSCSGSGGTGNCGSWESSSLSVGGILTFTGAVSNERYLQVQADLASDTTRQNTPIVGEVDLTYQITSTLPSVKYYYLGSQRVAMRGGNEVYYLHGDHLGSTSLTTDITGTVVAETRHHPFGEVRWQDGVNVTDFGFTGQREEVGFGLMDYNARYYNSGLGRFVSADTVVPDFDNSQALNRYSYVYNNPLIYVDPTGHCTEGTDNYETCLYIAQNVSEQYGYNVDDLVAFDWTLDQPAIEGGFALDNETVGFQAVSIDGYFVAIGQSYVFDIWVNDLGIEQHVLLMDAPGTANYDLLQEFKGYAQGHNTAEKSRNTRLFIAGGASLVSIGALYNAGKIALSGVGIPVGVILGFASLGSLAIAGTQGWSAWDQHSIMETNRTNAALQLNRLANFPENRNILSVNIDKSN